MLKSCFLLVLAGLLFSGCDDDPSKIIVPPMAEVIVTDLETGESVAGVKVMAVNQYRNTPIAGPFNTNDAGQIFFDVPPGAVTGYVVFGGLEWRLHSQDTLFAKARLTEKTPPVEAHLTRIVVRRTTPADGLPRIAGTVVDANTGTALNQAIVSTVPDLAAYNYAADSGSDVTTTNGSFVVQEIAFAANPETGNLIQLEWLFISRVGYQPRRWKYEPANGDNNLDISGVEIALTPLSDTDTGRLTGRLLLDGEPVNNVWVGLGGYTTAKSGMGVLGQTAQTDVDGIYEFTGLAPGTYVVDPGFILYDQVVYSKRPPQPVFDVSSGQTTTATDLKVYHEIIPFEGRDETFSISTTRALFSWTPVPNIFEYQVYIEGEEMVRTTATTLIWTIPPGTTPGWRRWRVNGVNEDGITLAYMQKTPSFQLVE